MGDLVLSRNKRYVRPPPDPIVAFSKFDPHAPQADEDEEEFSSEGARRRALLLRWGWAISMIYTAIGFGFILYWIATDA